MDRSPQKIRRSPINCSLSKATYAFPQAPRFRQSPSPICNRHSYDLTCLNLSAAIPRKQQSSSKSPRFRYKTSCEVPGPDSYLHRSFVEDAKRTGKGYKINQTERCRKVRIETSPSPCSYDPRVFQSSPFISFSPRYFKDQKNKLPVGPGAYQIGKYGTVSSNQASNIYSKYAGTSFYRIGHEERFKTKQKPNNNPGPGSYNQLMTDHKYETKYSFGHEKRKSWQTITPTPGPGTYQQFSEFAERRRKVESKLQKMSELLSLNR